MGLLAVETKRLTKTDLIARVAEKANVTKVESKRVLDAMLAVITQALAEGDKVILTGFGTFEVRTNKERTGVNPRTKEKMVIPAKKRPAFTAGAAFKRTVTG